MTATVLTEALHPMEPVVGFESHLSFDEVTIAQSQTIVVGQVLGSIGVAADESSTVAALAGNTGNGVLTMASIGSAAIDGTYSVEMITAGATAAFEITAPDGTIAGVGKVGTAFVGPINFTIAAGGTAFVVGDLINVTVLRPVGEPNEQWEAWNPAATDGSQIARAVAMYPAVTGSGVTAKISAARRQVSLRSADLTWNGSATATQIAEGVNQLLTAGIVLR